MKILLAEDDLISRKVISKMLGQYGECDITVDGMEALDAFLLALKEKNPYDLICLDIMMPKKDGLSVLREIRQKNKHVPVLLLTAKDSVEDRVRGLDAGANDYLVKPFAFEELLARIRVLLRRPEKSEDSCYREGGLEVHVDTHQVFRDGKEIQLSGKEFALLRYMIQNKGIVLSREKLEQHLWNYDYAGGSNVIDVYIRYLRKKIDESFKEKLIHTVRGAGYVLKEKV